MRLCFKVLFTLNIVSFGKFPFFRSGDGDLMKRIATFGEHVDFSGFNIVGNIWDAKLLHFRTLKYKSSLNLNNTTV